MTPRRWPLPPAAVALEILEPDEQPLATRLLAEDPAFRAEVARLRATTAALVALDEATWAPEPPPPLECPRVVDTGAGTDADADAAGEPRRRRRPGRRVALAAAAVAAVAAVAVVLAARGADAPIPAPPPTTLALRPLAGTAGRAQLTLNGAGTAAELRASRLRPSGAHDYYEAWLADDRGRMVSMGTFRVPRSGHVDVHMSVAVDVTNYELVDVSLEPDDGDPSHSDRSVLRARL
jgi:anti-sigma-K factor RskA